MSSGVHRLVAAYELLWGALCGLVGVLGLVAGTFLVPADLMFPLLFVAALIGRRRPQSRSDRGDLLSSPSR
jgi:hypothetical protein